MTMQQFVLQYVQVALGREWPNLRMLSTFKTDLYELDSTRQKFQV